jgi:RNA polymerase sigma factor (sigma-70 family)
MTMNPETTAEILERFRSGDPQAADELFGRYVDRLTRLARVRLSPALAARTDAEDIVMSAYRSFFIGARGGRFKLSRSGDLWRLLASITLHKLYREARRHGAAGRSIAKETPLRDAEFFGREPSPEEAVGVTDELQTLLASLEPFARRILEMRLQEESLATIAEATGRSERTVRRTLAEIRDSLLRRMERDVDE